MICTKSAVEVLRALRPHQLVRVNGTSAVVWAQLKSKVTVLVDHYKVVVVERHECEVIS